MVGFEEKSLCLCETAATVAEVATKHQRRDGAEASECAGQRKGRLARMRRVDG